MELRKIDGWEEYGVTDEGKVYSYRTKKWLKIAYNENGYAQVVFCRDYKCTSKRVHRLVFETFVRKLKPNEDVHHKNHIRDDNRVENLEAIDESIHLSWDLERNKRISKSNKGKKRTPEQCRKIGEGHKGKKYIKHK